MLVNKSIETPQGTVKFEGELEQKELDFVCPKCGFEDHIVIEGVQNFFE